MDPVTPTVPRARRSARRQAVLTCAFSAYVVAFAAGLLALASVAGLPSGSLAVAALSLAGLLAVAGTTLWAIDAAARRRALSSTVAFLTPMGTSVVLPARRVAR